MSFNQIFIVFEGILWCWTWSLADSLVIIWNMSSRHIILYGLLYRIVPAISNTDQVLMWKINTGVRFSSYGNTIRIDTSNTKFLHSWNSIICWSAWLVYNYKLLEIFFLHWSWAELGNFFISFVYHNNNWKWRSIK